jgi:uncharacterized protein (TIRG00374 family)
MVDLKAAWALLTASNLYWVALSFVFILPEVVLKGYRIRNLARTFNSPLSLPDANFIYLAGQPLGAITPAKLGDIVRVWGIAKLGNLRNHAAFAVHVADKVYDLLALLLLAATGLITLIAQAEFKGPAVAALMGMGFGILLMASFLNPQWMRSVIKPLLLLLAPKNLAEQLSAHGQEFYKELSKLFQPTGRLLMPFLLSLSAWAVVLLRTYFCSMAVGLPLSIVTIGLIMPVVIVIEFLPITILGFGTREAALFFFLASSAVSKEGLISFSMLTVVAGPLLTALAGLYCAMKLSDLVAKKP